MERIGDFLLRRGLPPQPLPQPPAVMTGVPDHVKQLTVGNVRAANGFERVVDDALAAMKEEYRR